jgi:MFS family permease
MITSRWIILSLLFVVRTGMGIQYQAVAALSPLLMSDFSLSIADIGLLVGLYHAPGTFLALPGGAIAARLGEKRVVVMGLTLMILGELFMGVAPTWAWQVGGRILAGTGGILLNVMMSKMVADWFAGKETATAMAIIGNAAPAGIALALVALPSIAARGGRLLTSSAVVAYLAAALVVLAIAYVTPAGVAPVIQRRSLWPEQPAVWALLAAGVVYGIYNVGLITIFAFGPLMLAERGWTFIAASSITSVVLWLVTISLPAGGVLADRSGRRALVLVSGLIAFAAAMVLSAHVNFVLLAFLVLGIASGLPCGAIMSLPTEVLVPETRPVGMGIFFTVYYALNVFGPWAIGNLAKIAGKPQSAFDVSAISLGVGVLIWLVFQQIVRRFVICKELRAIC